MKEKHLIQMRNEYSPQLSNCWYNCKLKNKEAHSYFKGLSEDGGRAGFSIKPRDISFNKDLSNKPNLGQIYLAGQYL
jgi:hypothetical protein